jgi:hypothetical protein
MMREEYQPQKVEELDHVYTLESDPSILITRVLHNIQVHDLKQEYYTTCPYHLRERGGHFIDKVGWKLVSKSYQSPNTDIQRRVNLQATYDICKSDPTFRLRDKHTFYSSKPLNWRCLLWILYLVVKEDILVSCNITKSFLSCSDGRLDFEMCFLYEEACYTFDFSSVQLGLDEKRRHG